MSTPEDQMFPLARRPKCGTTASIIKDGGKDLAPS